MKKNLIKLTILSCLGFLFLSPQQGISSPQNSIKYSSKSSFKIGVAAKGKKASSKISVKAGRAPFFLIFDGNGKLLKAVKNPGSGSTRDASTKAVRVLVKESCKLVVAGRFGYKMKRLLEDHNIKSAQRSGVAKKAVQSILKKKR